MRLADPPLRATLTLASDWAKSQTPQQLYMQQAQEWRWYAAYYTIRAFEFVFLSISTLIVLDRLASHAVHAHP